MANFLREVGRRLVVLGGALTLAVASPSLAEDSQSAESSSTFTGHFLNSSSGQAAVDGINGKLAFSKSLDGLEVNAVEGSVAVPVGHAFGLQIDGAWANIDLGLADDIDAYGAGAHLFWRDPSRGLLGVYGHAGHLDVPISGGLNFYTAAIENEIYWDRFSLENVAGFADADFIDADFFSHSTLAYYPTDNLRLDISHAYGHGTHTLGLGSEWSLGGGNGTAAAVFADARVYEDGETSAKAGMRFYFGQKDKSLKRRHREDDPSGAYLLGSVFLVAVGFGEIVVGFLEIACEIDIRCAVAERKWQNSHQ